MKNQVTIGLIGFGTIGSGTVQLLKQHDGDVEARVGCKVKLKWVCALDFKESKWLDASIQKTKNWKDVVNDPEVDCVIELIGGTHPAREIALAALQKGKHFITANKAILSKYWDEIFTTARDRSRLVYFEAAVGGGIPVIQALNEGLAGNRIQKIVGILNGTTNYILTRMQESGLDFEGALKEAQRAGFAEANPSFDIEGVDAAQKLSILGSIATGQMVPPQIVHTEGISKLQSLDIRLIEKELHGRIKLLAIGEHAAKGWIFRVHPTMIPQSHPFANVRNEYNAISLHGNAVQDVMLYGKGAGRLPTASAVLSDIMFLCRQIANGTAGELPYVIVRDHFKLKIASIENTMCKYYLRVTTKDKPGILARITGILGQNGVSIASVHQDAFERATSRKGVPIILLTHKSLESNVQASIKEIDRLPYALAKSVLIRMEYWS